MRYTVDYDRTWRMYCPSCNRTVAHRSTIIVMLAALLHDLLCYRWRGLTKDKDAA